MSLRKFLLAAVAAFTLFPAVADAAAVVPNVNPVRTYADGSFQDANGALYTPVWNANHTRLDGWLIESVDGYTIARRMTYSASGRLLGYQDYYGGQVVSSCFTRTDGHTWVCSSADESGGF
jgi:hypothetical protein